MYEQDFKTFNYLLNRLPAFFPHVAGVVVTVRVAKKYAEWTWALAGIGLVLEGVSCFFIPFCTNYFLLMIPICVICFGIALIDTALLPLLGFIVDKKVSNMNIILFTSISFKISDITSRLLFILSNQISVCFCIWICLCHRRHIVLCCLRGRSDHCWTHCGRDGVYCIEYLRSGS